MRLYSTKLIYLKDMERQLSMFFIYCLLNKKKVMPVNIMQDDLI